jgi:hypothetical protein
VKLSKHFDLNEFVYSPTAIRLGIDNRPGSVIIERLRVVAEGLEIIRNSLGEAGSPIIIDSGYRCQELNKAVHGAWNSAHLWGWAADIRSKTWPSLAIAKRAIEIGLQFDQLIMEGTWVHVSFDPKMRGEILTARFREGVATYTRGLPNDSY